jgi:hypothetical protein
MKGRSNDINHFREKQRDCIDQEAEVIRHEASRLIRFADNGLHNQRIKTLLQEEKIGWNTKSWLTKQLDWLNADPNRQLSPQDRLRLKRLEDFIRIGKDTGNWEVPPNKKRRFVKAWSKAELGKERPAWMSDPSLLPKRPPTSQPSS